MTRDEQSERRRLAGRSFPQHNAFVLQFSADTDPESGLFQGRIEHVTSGDRAAFRSAEDVWAFVRSVLARAGEGIAAGDRNKPSAAISYTMQSGDESYAETRTPSEDDGQSFLGVVFPDPVVARVRIVYGMSPLGQDERAV